MKRIILLLCLLLAGCATADQETLPAAQTTAATQPTEPAATMTTQPCDPIGEILAGMTLEQRVGQLFLVGVDPNLTQAHISDYGLGGLLLFAHDFTQDAAEKIARWQELADIPLLMATDEEGGTVTRVSCHEYFRSSRFSSPRALYDQGGTEAVLDQERDKCALLGAVGVNVNLGPVCDITTDPDAFLYRRSLGKDADTTGATVAAMVRTMTECGIGSALKHFPGYGNNTDTHTGIARDSRSLEALEDCDLVPFRAGIEAGAGAVLVSHTIVEALDAELPASLSPAVHRYLRQEMGFTGVIITDDLTMGAITERYGAGEAAVLALQAGNDLLCCSAYTEQYQAVLEAVLDGRIEYDTLTSAVRNVLQWKLELGLL